MRAPDRRWGCGVSTPRPAPRLPQGGLGRYEVAGAGVTGFHWGPRAGAGIPWRRNACDGGVGLSLPCWEVGPGCG